MVKEIFIYAEGGGDGKDTKDRMRQGFGSFFKDIVKLARERRVKWHIVACGSRKSAYDSFQTAYRSHPEAFNLLLVDSEGAVKDSPCEHLTKRDGWDFSDIDDEQVHLMVQMMEAWMVADVKALKEYYSHQGFNSKQLPKTLNVEEIDKPTLIASLKAATKNTSKGEYQKSEGPKILGKLDASKVCKAAPHCERLFKTLEEKITS